MNRLRPLCRRRRVDALLEWFVAQAADLPWRRERTPYRIWLAEVMLMQTRVATVLRYYERFLEVFPTLEALAAAPLDEVLKRWEGLGYYARARNLQRAARQILAQYGGVFPQRYEQWLALPGIGPYSAAAIASIAFGEARAAVDGNVRRVLARLLDEPGDIRQGPTQRRLASGPGLARPGNAGDAQRGPDGAGATDMPAPKSALSRLPAAPSLPRLG